MQIQLQIHLLFYAKDYIYLTKVDIVTIKVKKSEE